MVVGSEHRHHGTVALDPDRRLLEEPGAGAHLSGEARRRNA
jgi:hypothetical protein